MTLDDGSDATGEASLARHRGALLPGMHALSDHFSKRSLARSVSQAEAGVTGLSVIWGENINLAYG